MVHWTAKPPVLVEVPAGVVTLIAPDAAPAGTVAVILVADSTVKAAGTPPKATALVPSRPRPVIVTAADRPRCRCEPFDEGRILDHSYGVVAVAGDVDAIRGLVDRHVSHIVAHRDRAAEAPGRAVDDANGGTTAVSDICGS